MISFTPCTRKIVHVSDKDNTREKDMWSLKSYKIPTTTLDWFGNSNIISKCYQTSAEETNK